MKKYLFMAALAVVATFTFTACSDDDDDNKDNKSSYKKTSNYDDAFTFDRSSDTNFFEEDENGKMQLTPNGRDQIKQYFEEGNTEEAMVQLMLLFGASGEDEILAVLADGLVAPEGKGKSLPFEEAVDVISKYFTENPFGTKERIVKKDLIQLPFQFVSDTYKKSGDKYVTFKGSELTVKDNVLKFIKKGGKTLELKGKLTQTLSDNDLLIATCRGWIIEQIGVEVTKPNKDVVGKVWKTTNLSTIANDLVNNFGVHVSAEDLAEIQALGSIKKVVFDKSKSFDLYFDKKIYKGSFDILKIGKDFVDLNYKFIDKEMKNAFIEAAGQATVSFDKNNVLNIKSTYTNKNGEVYLVDCNFFLKKAKK